MHPVINDFSAFREVSGNEKRWNAIFREHRPLKDEPCHLWTPRVNEDGLPILVHEMEEDGDEVDVDNVWDTFLRDSPGRTVPYWILELKNFCDGRPLFDKNWHIIPGERRGAWLHDWAISPSPGPKQARRYPNILTSDQLFEHIKEQVCVPP